MIFYLDGAGVTMKITQYDQFNLSPWGGHAKIVELVGKNKKVLDVGCATGLLAKELKKRGNKIYGIEIDPEQAEIAKKFCEETLMGDIENIEIPYKPNYFDVILFADILEHLKAPEQVLSKLSKFLKNDGFCIVVLPNIAHIYVRIKLLFGIFKYEEIGILDRTHLRFFTYKTARKLIEDSGFQVEETYITIPNIPRKLAFNKRFYIFFKVAHQIAKFWKGGLAFQFIFKVRKKGDLL